VEHRRARLRVLYPLMLVLSMLGPGVLPQLAHAGHGDPLQYTSVLDNGVIKVGIDANAGGVISYLSPSGSSTNLINTYDQGREVQQSYYAGPDYDRRAEGQSQAWSPWPWNPIGAGDAFGNAAVILELGVTSTTIYVKSQPLLWDMNNERCQCFFRTWITLEGGRVRVHNTLTTFRTDTRGGVVSRAQELPAVYPIAALPRVVSYTGTQPFTSGPITEIPPTTQTWANWTTREHWGACVNAANFGVGVYTPGRSNFVGGLHGDPGGTTTSSSTCYVAPLEAVPLDRTTTFDYDYWLAVGTVDTIRHEFYEVRQTAPLPPAGFPSGDGQTWAFDADGDFGGWRPIANIASSSVSSGHLAGKATSSDPYMDSPAIGKPARDWKVTLRMRNGTASSKAQLFFTTATDGAWTGSKSKRISIAPNSPYRAYAFDMTTVATWRGTITGLRLDPAEASGDFAIDWIRIGSD
jgi:hypothetical protein